MVLRSCLVLAVAMRCFLANASTELGLSLARNEQCCQCDVRCTNVTNVHDECNVRRGWVGENFLNVSVMLAHVDATGAI